MRLARTRLGHVARLRVSNVDKHTVEGELPVRLCNYTDVYKNETIVDGMPFMEATATTGQVAQFRVQAGDTVFTKDSETADDIGIPAFVESAGPDLVSGYHLAILRPDRTRIDPKFLFWTMKSRGVLAQWEVLATGVTRVGLKQRDMTSVSIQIPESTGTQRAIADFLDRETAKIDALIEKQNALIDRLRERRETLVESCLTNSGRVGALSYFVDCLPGYAFGSEGFVGDSEGSVRLLRGVNVKPRRLEWIDAAYWTDDSLLGRYRLAVGDLVLGMDRPFIGDGTRVAVVGDQDLPALLVQRVLRLRPKRGVNASFIYYMLMTRGFREYATPEATGVSVPHISDKQVRSFVARFPDYEEQSAIVARLDDGVRQIEDLITKAERFVGLARERRSALITAAVTGQIDVSKEAAA